MKKFIALLLAVLMMGLSVPVYAEETSPWYIHILHMTEDFEVSSNGVAFVNADIAIRSGAYCTIVAKVQRETASGWSTVATLKAMDDNHAMLEETTRLTRGYNYRCIFTFTVYDEMDFQLEQKSFISQEEYY